MIEDATQSRPSAGPLAFLRRTADISLYVRVLAVNAAILAISVGVLIFTPVTVSRNVTNYEVAVLLFGLVLTIVANAVLLRLSLRPLRRLMEMMLVIDVVEPGVRPPAQGPIEVASVIARFNAMLDRLEHERRHSMRRVLVAQEAERRRVAQELHDEIGQNLTAAVLELNRVREGGVVLEDALDDAQALARESLETLSAITARLRPATFDDLGLASALQSLAADSERRTGIEVETAFDGALHGPRRRRRAGAVPGRPGGRDERAPARRVLARHDPPAPRRRPGRAARRGRRRRGRRRRCGRGHPWHARAGGDDRRPARDLDGDDRRHRGGAARATDGRHA